MSFPHLDKIIFHHKASLKKVLEGFNKTAIHTEKSGFGIIVNDSGKCIGVVSDGDIRRKIIENIPLKSSIEKAMNRNFSYVNDGDDSHKILRQFDKQVTNLPVLDDKSRPIDLLQYSNFVFSYVCLLFRSSINTLDSFLRELKKF